MLTSFLVGAGVYAFVCFVCFVTVSWFNQTDALRISILFIEWLFVSFFIFGIIMMYIIWSTQPNA